MFQKKIEKVNNNEIRCDMIDIYDKFSKFSLHVIWYIPFVVLFDTCFYALLYVFQVNKRGNSVKKVSVKPEKCKISTNAKVRIKIISIPKKKKRRNNFYYQ